MIVGWSTLGGALFMLLTLNVLPEPLLGFAIGTALTWLGLLLYFNTRRRVQRP